MRRILCTLSLLTLAAALACSTTRPAAPPAERERTIPITARRFEFEPKLLTLKRGEAVTLELTSADVPHGFFSRPLGIDADLTPGNPERVSLRPKEAGTYTVICDHYCGSGHGGMKMTIVVE